jgi:hypothetical protein
MQFSPASCHFIPLQSKYRLKFPQLVFHNVWDQVSHPNKTTDEIIIFHPDLVVLNNYMKCKIFVQYQTVKTIFTKKEMKEERGLTG